MPVAAIVAAAVAELALALAAPPLPAAAPGVSGVIVAENLAENLSRVDLDPKRSFVPSGRTAPSDSRTGAARRIAELRVETVMSAPDTIRAKFGFARSDNQPGRGPLGDNQPGRGPLVPLGDNQPGRGPLVPSGGGALGAPCASKDG